MDPPITDLQLGMMETVWVAWYMATTDSTLESLIYLTN